jgi:tetratricopeptide (TPR) repeat protein
MQHSRQWLRLATVMICTQMLVIPNFWGSGKGLAEGSGPEFEFKDFEFWAAQCRSFSAEKLYAEALKACEKAIPLNLEKKPANRQQATLDLWKLRSHALLHLGRYQEAIGSYDYVLGIQPAYSQGLTNRCDALAKLGRYESAIASCDQALQVDGEWGEITPSRAWLIRGQALQKMSNLPDAIAAYDQVLAATPNDNVVIAERCQAIVDLRQMQAAPAKSPTETPKSELDLKQTQAAPTKDPTETPKSESSTSLQERLEKERQEKEIQEQAVSCIKSTQTAITQAATDKTQLSAAFWYKQGLISQRQDQFEAAKDAFKQAVIAYENELVKDPNVLDAWIYQGMALEHLGQFASALTSYERALQLRPNASLALVNQCAVLNRLRQFQAAFTACENALKGDGLWQERTTSDAWSQRSSALLGLQRYQDAVASADRAIALNPNDAEALNYKAIGLWYLKDYDNAKTAAVKAIALTNRQYPQALFSLGRILSSQPISDQEDTDICLKLPKNQAVICAYTDALNAYKTQVEMGRNPAEPLFRADILTNQAVALWRSGQSALSTAQEAANLNPGSFEVNLNHGIIAVDAGWLAENQKKDGSKFFYEALKAFQKANQIKPNNLYVITGQGCALQGLNRLREAIASLKTALAIDPTYEPARQLLEKIIQNQKNPADNSKNPSNNPKIEKPEKPSC